METKYIFLDIDGTLAVPGYSTSKENIKAIKEARENGHMVFLSTGRPKKDVPQDILDIGFDGGIYAAGGQVEVEGEEIVEKTLTSESVKLLTKLLNQLGIHYFLEGRDENYLSHDEQFFFEEMPVGEMSSEMMRQAQIESRDGNDLKPPVSIDEYNEKDSIYKINFRIPSSRTDLAKRLKKAVEKYFSICFFDVKENFDFDTPYIIGEITDRAINKGDGIREVIECYDADMKDTIAFGDSMNDLPMFMEAAIGVAMQNSTDKFKSYADLVCESCSESGVAKEFERLGLIDKGIDYDELIELLEEKVRDLWENSSYSNDFREKNGFDVVTQTDLEFERELIRTLQDFAPEITILSEEYLNEEQDDETYFTIDPVDGTWNYSHNVPIYGTQISLVVDGEPVVGLVYLPVFDYMFTSVVNHGAYLNGKKINTVSEELERSIIAISDFRKLEKDLEIQLEFAKLVTERFGRPRVVGCTSYDLAMVACGSYQGKGTYRYNLWDVMPGILLVREAGGYTYLDDKFCVAAANEKIGKAILDALKESEKKASE